MNLPYTKYDEYVAWTVAKGLITRSKCAKLLKMSLSEWTEKYEDLVQSMEPDYEENIPASLGFSHSWECPFCLTDLYVAIGKLSGFLENLTCNECGAVVDGKELEELKLKAAATRPKDQL